MNLKLLTVYIIIIFFSCSPLQAQSANALLQNMDFLISAPKDKEAHVLMVIKDKNGSVKEREASLKQKGKFKKLYRYTKPDKQAGIATLSLPDNIIWLYMPAFGKAVKISLLSKSQAFTGTDFSQEDMSGIPYSERYDPAIINVNDPDFYILELTPKSKKTKYSKIILTMDKTNYYPIKMEFFNKSNNYFKLATYKYKKQDNYWYAKEVIMTSVLKNHSTSIILSNVKFDQGMNDDVFTIENLKAEVEKD
ncbi:MAG: outer membrane lipoprotein-sorting protein [Flavobacteriaceae bacterium]|nr:outer membrane lipoprotein-sorting protein [Flavobacteriaceae bacterium]